MGMHADDLIDDMYDMYWDNSGHGNDSALEQHNDLIDAWLMVTEAIKRGRERHAKKEANDD